MDNMEGFTIAPTLPFGDINLVVLTDVHSWVNGHGTNEGPDNLDVGYGDVVSFFERLKEDCYGGSDDTECGDLWLVQNGDWIDGTGLALDGDPSALIPLLERVPFDVLNTGNHELYKDSVVQEMRRPGGFLQWWGHRHLASNIYMNDLSIEKNNPSPSVGKQLEPMSNRYHVLNGRRSTVLVFGFIYNLPNPSDLLFVETVEEAVQEDWFREALTDETIGYNAILVMLHAGHDDPSVEILRESIRRITKEAGIDPNGDLPIQFVAGHTHYRRYAVADPQSTVVEAGRYMDTVGWVSFPNSVTIRNEKDRRRRKLDSGAGNFTDSNESMLPSTEAPAVDTAAVPQATSSVTDLFHHVFLDANVATLRESLGLPPHGSDDDFQTPLGREVSEFIDETRDSLGLTQHLGCAPQDYQLNVSMAQEDSLWRLHRDEVGPHVLATAQLLDDADASSASGLAAATNHRHRCLFMSQDSYRYGLFGGDHLSYDDIIVVSPFNEPIYRVAILPCSTMRQLNEIMNDGSTVDFYNTLPSWIMAMDDGGSTMGAHASEPSGNNASLAVEEPIPVDGVCELFVNHFGLSRVEQGLQKTIRAESSGGDSGPSTMWNPIETNLTTTNIWTSFVADNWQCSGGSRTSNNNGKHSSLGGKWKGSMNQTIDKWKGSMNQTLGGKEYAGVVLLDADGSFTTGGKIAVSLVVLCLLAVCWCAARCCCCKRRRTRSTGAYDGVFHDGEYRDGEIDDGGFDEYNSQGNKEMAENEEETPVRIV